MAAEKLIINADDLGMWPSIDLGILAAWAEGGISDSTLMATSPNLPAVLHAAEAAGLPAGVHLNLTNGAPLSDPAEIPALVTPEGVFLRRQQWQHPLPIPQIRLELTRQVELILAHGWQPTHLDSHHHAHNTPEVLAVTIELAREHQLPVRATSDAMRDALRSVNIPTTDHFTIDFYAAATVERLIQLVDSCPGGVLEIMAHPGFISPDQPGAYRDDRQRELDALIDPRWHAYLAEKGIPLVGFREGAR